MHIPINSTARHCSGLFLKRPRLLHLLSFAVGVKSIKKKHFVCLLFVFYQGSFCSSIELRTFAYQQLDETYDSSDKNRVNARCDNSDNMRM